MRKQIIIFVAIFLAVLYCPSTQPMFQSSHIPRCVLTVAHKMHCRVYQACDKALIAKMDEAGFAHKSALFRDLYEARKGIKEQDGMQDEILQASLVGPKSREKGIYNFYAHASCNHVKSGDDKPIQNKLYQSFQGISSKTFQELDLDSVETKSVQATKQCFDSLQELQKRFHEFLLQSDDELKLKSLFETLIAQCFDEYMESKGFKLISEKLLEVDDFPIRRFKYCGKKDNTILSIELCKDERSPEIHAISIYSSTTIPNTNDQTSQKLIANHAINCDNSSNVESPLFMGIDRALRFAEMLKKVPAQKPRE
ncbi:MAG: hypothetical protein NTZ68_00645 [Candidatus Dependentiae bacterium]|nr:hypothetical protein [Candidatus Dependentiae bacterium]